MKTKTRFNKLTAWLLTITMLMTFIPSFTLTAFADSTSDGVTAYTKSTGFYGEASGSASASVAVELYEGSTKIATATTTTIADNDTYSWSIPFNTASADENWTVEWADGYPKYDMNPDKVKLIIDGSATKECEVQYNDSNGENEIVALAEGDSGGVVAYTTLTDAIGNFNGRKVNVLCGVIENIAAFNGCTLTTNVEDGVIITNTNDNWVYMNDLNIGKRVTLKCAYIFYDTDGVNAIEGTLEVSGTFYHGYNAKTTIQNGGNVIVEGANASTIVRYNTKEDAGLYIYGDGDDETVEFKNSYYIGAYSGTFYAKDANIETGYFLLKPSYDTEIETDNVKYPPVEMTLDNSTLKTVGASDGQGQFTADEDASITLKNGSTINVKTTFSADDTVSVFKDETSSIKDASGTVDIGVAAYTITFDANGGTVTPTSETTGTGRKLTELPTPTYNGYVFNGWFTATTGGTKITTDTVFSANTTVYAQWTKALASVTTAANVTTYYADLASALDAAKDGDTVTVLAGEHTGDVTVNKDITVVGETDDNGDNLVTISGKLSVTGNGATVKNLNIDYSTNTDSDVGTLYISGGDILVEGCTITGHNGLRYCYANNGDVTLKNCVITGNIYGIHFVRGSGDGDVIIDGCTISGWTSFGSGVEEVTISNTTFADGNYNLLRFYQNATLTNVTIPSGDHMGYQGSGMRIDTGNGGAGMEGVTVTAINCNTTDGSAFAGAFDPDTYDESDIYVDGELLGAVAKIADTNGNIYFKTLAKAIDAVPEEGTVTLLKDITEEIVVSKALTIKLNYCTAEKVSPSDGYIVDTSDATKLVFEPVISVTGVTLDKTTASLKVGKSITLTATVEPTDATYKTVTWTSDNTSVATVADDGTVTAVASGTAAITAAAGDKTATCTVTVTRASNGGGSGSPNTTTTTTKNDDGSTTKTTTNKATGTTTETTTYPDGSATKVETKKDGTVTTTEKDKDGNTTTTVENPDGSSTTTEKNKDGSETVVEKEADGTTTTTEKDSEGNKTVTTEKADGTTTTEETKKDGTKVTTETNADGETTAEVEAKGETEVVIPVENADEVTKVVVTDKDGVETEARFEVKDGGIAISVSGNSTVSVQTGHICYAKDFTDVDIDAWYHLNIDYVLETGLMKGTAADKFVPDDNLTRAMLVTVLYRAEGEPETASLVQREGDRVSGGGIVGSSFEDVDSGAYYGNAVSWAQQNGIVNGVSETEFAPDQNITREQIAAIMHRYASYKGYDVQSGENTNILSYSDYDSISEYAVSSMQYAVGSGLMKGKTTSTLNPSDNATRAEIAAILNRFIEANK